MKHPFRYVALPLLFVMFAPVHAADIKKGEQLVNSQCVSCHATRFSNNGSDIYTRPDRRVTSLVGLKKQVIRCRDNLKLTWFDEDVEDVVGFLNARYYKFK